MYTYIYTWKKKSNNKNSQGERELFKSECWRRDTDSPPPPPKKKISSSKKKKSPYETRTAVESPCARRPVPEGKKIAEKIDSNPFLDPRYVTRKFISRSRSAKEGVATPVTNPWTRQWAGPPPSPCNAPLSPPLFFFFLSHVERRQKYRCATICIPGKKIKRKKKGGASGKGETKNEDGARKKRGKKGGIVGKIRIN